MGSGWRLCVGSSEGRGHVDAEGWLRGSVAVAAAAEEMT
jgi:hypothetical protein